MHTANIIEDRVSSVWLHIVCYRDRAVDQHRDPNNEVLPNLCGLGMVKERRDWGVGDAGLYQLFLGGVLLEPTKRITEREREQPENCWHCPGYMGTRICREDGINITLLSTPI